MIRVAALVAATAAEVLGEHVMEHGCAPDLDCQDCVDLLDAAGIDLSGAGA